jgi:hypothetical protein
MRAGLALHRRGRLAENTVSDIFEDTPETDESIAWVKRPVNTRTIRSTHEYKTAREQYRLKCSVHRQPDGTKGDPCVICGERVDYNLRYPHPFSWSLEHLISVKDRPDLLLDENNWASAHFGCNSMKGDEELVPDTGSPSELWIWLPLVTSGSFWLWNMLLSNGAVSLAGKIITRSVA